MYRIAMNVEL